MPKARYRQTRLSGLKNKVGKIMNKALQGVVSKGAWTELPPGSGWVRSIQRGMKTDFVIKVSALKHMK